MSEVLLLSGGLDSICLAFWLRPALCLTINYGQRSFNGEQRAAIAVVGALDLRHRVLQVPSNLGAGIMAGAKRADVSPWDEFWPFRNQLLVTYAACAALAEGLSEVVIGTVKTDTRHADGSKRFLKGLSRVLAMQEGNIELRAPASSMTSVQLIRQTKVPLDVLAYAHSCHRAEYACGRCPGCDKHSDTMRKLGIDR